MRSGKVRAGCRAHSIWHKPCPIVGAAGAQERLSRCRTFAEAAGVSGADLELFVPHAEQRLWRTVIRTKYQLRRNKVRLHNQLEALLEEAHIKLSSLVSRSARRKCTADAGSSMSSAIFEPVYVNYRSTLCDTADDEHQIPRQRSSIVLACSMPSSPGAIEFSGAVSPICGDAY